jgi:hypothetical protein
MVTFVLVHGAWLGGWCWKRVRPLLTAQRDGHRMGAHAVAGDAAGGVGGAVGRLSWFLALVETPNQVYPLG